MLDGVECSHSANTLADCIAVMQLTKQKLYSNCKMDFSDRIREAISNSGKSQAAIAREAGISQSAIAQYLSGNVKSLRGETAARLEAATGYSATWLINGKGPKQLVAEATPTVVESKPVPLISWVQAGSWRDVIDNFAPGDAEEWIQCPARHSASSYALRVRGDSMFNPAGSPSFRDGDIIFVDPGREAIHRSLVVVRLDDESESTFKQLLVEGDQRHLQALNPNWPNRIMPINGRASICGVVFGKFEPF